MRKMAWLVATMLVLMTGTWTTAEEVAGLPLHVTRLDPRAVRLWVGDYISSTAVVAFATSKGIVVVDTMGNPKIDSELRNIIARELGRTDFKTLIITHEHGDHTGGSSVYADCTIVGHDLLAVGMDSTAANRQRHIEWLQKSIQESKQKLAQLQPGSPEAKKLKEEMIFNRLNLDALESNVKPVPPIKTFTDRLKLPMGDTTFELYYIGGMHSASDIAILVPEHGVLLTGDTMADTWLNETPGCLAAFVARPGVRHDFPLLLANWDLILAQKDRIKLLLPGHWNAELSLAGAVARVDYVRTLWQGIGTAAKEGKGLAEVQAEYSLDTRFAPLAKSPGCSQRNNSTTITEMWRLVTNQQSAAEKLHTLIDEGASEAAIREVLAEHDAKVPKYFFVEGEINEQGYRFLRDNKIDKAVVMFKLNVELFPEAWNVYDSLGEALLKAGDTTRATAMYEKSVTLNPENKNGKEALIKIRAAAAKK